MTNSKFDSLYECKHSTPEGIMRATDVTMASKKAVVSGDGNMGQGGATAPCADGGMVHVTEIDPICALQACV